MPPRPLHYQKAVGRNVVVHERADLHLVWDEQRIFLKPIPRYLLDRDFWRHILSCEGGCESTSQCKSSRSPPPRFEHSEKHLREKCAVCQLRPFGDRLPPHLYRSHILRIRLPHCTISQPDSVLPHLALMAHCRAIPSLLKCCKQYQSPLPLWRTSSLPPQQNLHA